MRKAKNHKLPGRLKSDRIHEDLKPVWPLRVVDKDGSYHRRKIDERLQEAMEEVYRELGIEPE